MPGTRPAGFHEGDRAEYLTTFVLSSIAAVIPVPRQEDYGIDHLCALTQRAEQSLYVKKAFGVQVKAASVRKLCYGGFGKKGNKKGKWRSWEVEWLYKQDYPMFIASVDNKTWQLKLYSTIRMWWVRWMRGRPCQVNLIPDQESFSGPPEDEPYSYQELDVSDDGYGDGREWEVPLGRPVIDVKVSDLESKEVRDQLYQCLDRWISLDRRNITHHQLGIPCSFQFAHWEPNEIPEDSNIRPIPFSNPVEDQNIKKILSAITPGIMGLMYNFRRQNQHDHIGKVAPIVELLEEYSHGLDAGSVKMLKQMQAFRLTDNQKITGRIATTSAETSSFATTREQGIEEEASAQDEAAQEANPL